MALRQKDTNTTVQYYYLWDGPTLLAELHADKTVRAEYSYYPGGLDNVHAVVIDSTPYFAHVDGLGNVIALTNANKSVERTYVHETWGELASGTDNLPFNDTDRARFKGALWFGDEVDLYYMRNRWYEPHSGRFLSEDPLGLAGGINLYTFAGSNPVERRDPTGLDECAEHETGHKDFAYTEWIPEELLLRSVYTYHDCARETLDANRGGSSGSPGSRGGPGPAANARITNDRAMNVYACPDQSVVEPVVQPNRVSSGFLAPRGIRFHGGLDYSGPSRGMLIAGANVYPMLPGGTVTVAGNLGGDSGNSVYISHGNGWTTHYRHLATISVSRGDSSSIFAVLGTVGSTGTSVAHLHAELQYRGVKVDPERCGA